MNSIEGKIVPVYKTGIVNPIAQDYSVFSKIISLCFEFNTPSNIDLLVGISSSLNDRLEMITLDGRASVSWTGLMAYETGTKFCFGNAYSFYIYKKHF